MIQVNGLTKKYGTKLAVDNISFRIKKGEIVGFLGPNGAGKSTTMNMITGYISMTGGTAQIAGFDVLDDPIEARRHIGYLPELPPLYMEMTVKEYLGFVFDLKGVKGKSRRAHIDEVCELVDITHVQNRIIGNLSKGYKQRVGLAQALIGDPDVMILDEPTVGLDPNQITEIRNMIRSLGKQRTIILSTHILQEVKAVCERVLVINNGKIVADGSTDELTHTVREENRFIARIAGIRDTVVSVIRSVPGVAEVNCGKAAEAGAYDYIIVPAPGADIRKDLFFALAESNMPLLSFTEDTVSLEDVFAALTVGGETLMPKAEEAPAEEIPAEEAPAEEIPAEEAPAEEAPAEEIPAEETNEETEGDDK